MRAGLHGPGRHLPVNMAVIFFFFIFFGLLRCTGGYADLCLLSIPFPWFLLVFLGILVFGQLFDISFTGFSMCVLCPAVMSTLLFSSMGSQRIKEKIVSRDPRDGAITGLKFL